MAPAVASISAASVVVLMLGVATLSPARRTAELVGIGGESSVLSIEGSTFQNPAQMYADHLTSAASPSQQDIQQVLQGIKAQQAAAEAQMKQLMKVNHRKASALSHVLDGDTFNVALSSPKKAPVAKAKMHPRSGRPLAVTAKTPIAPQAGAPQKKKAEMGAKAPVKAARGYAAPDPTQVQARIVNLLAHSNSMLNKDERRTITDLTTKAAQGPWFQQQQTMHLRADRERVLGDEKLIKLLTAMQHHLSLSPSPMQNLDAIDMQARNDLAAAEMRARQHGIADELNPNTQHILAAGVHAGHSREYGLGGMEASSDWGMDGGDEDYGSEALEKAGIRTDALPGFGTKYRQALPLPFFDDAREGQVPNVTALEDHHRPISPAGEHMLRHLKVNLAAPNMFVYGDEGHSTPKADRYRDEYGKYGFFDGLEDAETNSTIARQHKPLTFWISNPKKGSKALAGKGNVNVYGESTWDGILSHMPQFVTDWSHPVVADPSRPPEHWLSDNHWVEKTPSTVSATWNKVTGHADRNAA